MLIFILLFLSIPLVSEQDTQSLAALNIVTMIPGETIEKDALGALDLATTQHGVKQLTADIKAKKDIDTTILAFNRKTKKNKLIKVHSGVPNSEHGYDKKQFLSTQLDGWLVLLGAELYQMALVMIFI